MAATSYSSLLPYLNIHLDGVPAPVALGMVNLAARELCLQSSCWHEWEDIPLESGVNEYSVTPPSASAMVRAVKYIGIGMKALIPETETTVLDAKRHLLTAVGEPEVFYMLNDMTIKVLPTPTDADVGKVMKVKTAFVPALDATAIPKEFIERFSETLIAGALFFLMSMPGKAWSNPQLAQMYKGAFDIGVDQARIEVQMSYSPANMRVTSRRFGARA